MASELVYTSVPKGLTPGSFGFCTVARSRSLDRLTVATLERLSNYRRVVGAKKDPIVYSHLLVDDSGSTKRVLSRIAPAGLDYSNRENKIACHFVLDNRDLVEAGPAALCSARGLFVEKWNEGPKYFDNPISMPDTLEIDAPCYEWERVAGDRGWAGVIASTALSCQNAVLVVDERIDALRLFRESLALLQPRVRWNVTFSTYYTKMHPGVRCQWKAVMKGSPEEESLSALDDVVYFDLTNPRKLPSIDKFLYSPGVKKLVFQAREQMDEYDEESDELETPKQFQPSRVNDSNETETRRESFRNAAQRVRDTRRPPRASRSARQRETEREQSYSRSPKFEIDRGRAEERSSKTLRLWIRFSLLAIVAGLLVALVAFFILSTSGMSPFDGLRQYIRNAQEIKNAADPQADLESDAQKFYDEGEEYAPTNGKKKQPNPNDMFYYDENAEEEEIEEDPLTDSEKNGDSASDAGSNSRSKSSSKNASQSSKTKSSQTSKKTTPRTEDDDLFSFDDEEETIAGDVEKKTTAPSRSRFPLIRPNALNDQEYQEMTELIQTLDAGGASCDFGLFDQNEKNNKDATLTVALVGDVQTQLQRAYKLVRKYHGTIEISCDISADRLEKYKFVDTRKRVLTKKISFEEAENAPTSEAIELVFEIVPREDPDSIAGSFTIAFMNDDKEYDGKCAFGMSDETTRNYLLGSAKLQWRFVFVNSKNNLEDEFNSQAVQLLKPYEFLNDSNINILPFGIFTEANGESAFELTDPGLSGELRKQYALIVELAQTPSAERSSISGNSVAKDDVDSIKATAERDKKDLVFTVVDEIDNEEEIEFLKITFTKQTNGRKLSYKKSYAPLDMKESLKVHYVRQLNDELNTYRRRSDPMREIEVASDRLVEKKMKYFDDLRNGEYAFNFYFAILNRNYKTDKNDWILVGTTAITQNTDAHEEKSKRSKRIPPPRPFFP